MYVIPSTEQAPWDNDCAHSVEIMSYFYNSLPHSVGLRRYEGRSNAVLCKTCSVLCVVEQPRGDNSISRPFKIEAHLGAIGPIDLMPTPLSRVS